MFCTSPGLMAVLRWTGRLHGAGFGKRLGLLRPRGEPARHCGGALIAPAASGVLIRAL